jgi:glyoxylase-like metal-dependent hydrolase (beta-lactamase superfamily II)
MPATEVEEICPGLYRAVIPLPNNPLKATNSYIIIDKDRSLVIDTGMNLDVCRDALLQALQQIDIDPDHVDFFATHLHADHIGLVETLSSDNSKIYFNKPDAELLDYPNIWKRLLYFTARHGFPPELVEKAITSHPGQRFKPYHIDSYSLVAEGDLISYGGYEMQCIVTPGHTRGHTCLYEPNHKILISGDHILGDITPNIATWIDDNNPLADYMNSLDRVYAMDIDLVLPGHRSYFRDCRSRIDEIKVHHALRLEEVRKVLEDNRTGSAYDVASLMTWDIIADGWDDFPLMQKWFATAEALAHILYLESEGELKREMNGQTMVFSIK